MNRTLEKITKEMYNLDLDFVNIKSGNYRVKRNKFQITHFYYGNVICKVDIINKTFCLYDCGYTNYKLTTAQLNWLENFYKNKLLYRGN